MKDENVNNSGTSNETAVIPKIVIFKAYIIIEHTHSTVSIRVSSKT